MFDLTRFFIKTSHRAAVLAMLFFCVSCSESDYEIYADISGKVSDATTSEPLSGALITLAPTNQTKQSEADGTFVFENLDAGQYTLTVQKEGYQTNRKTIVTFSGEQSSVNILLKSINQQ